MSDVCQYISQTAGAHTMVLGDSDELERTPFLLFLLHKFREGKVPAEIPFVKQLDS